MLNWAVSQDMIDTSPLVGYQKPRARRVGRANALVSPVMHARIAAEKANAVTLANDRHVSAIHIRSDEEQPLRG